VADIAIADGRELCTFHDKCLVEGWAAGSGDFGDFLMARPKNKAGHREGEHDYGTE
jgi:hypothetical protein